MKKLIVAALALSASQVFAAAAITDNEICKGLAATKATIGEGSGAVVTAADVVFIRTGFEFQCSNNVFLYAEENSPTLLTVGSASAKGNQYFGGSSNGGAITAINKCPDTGCTKTEAQSGASTAAGS